MSQGEYDDVYAKLSNKERSYVQKPKRRMEWESQVKGIYVALSRLIGIDDDDADDDADADADDDETNQ